jgi:hypothetical protein
MMHVVWSTPVLHASMIRRTTLRHTFLFQVILPYGRDCVTVKDLDQTSFILPISIWCCNDRTKYDSVSQDPRNKRNLNKQDDLYVLCYILKCIYHYLKIDWLCLGVWFLKGPTLCSHNK